MTNTTLDQITRSPLQSSSSDWFHEAKWGVFTHWLSPRFASPEVLSPEEWNRRVEAFDVDALALQLESVGAPYFFLTIGQNSGFFCAPNSAYDAIVGRSPSRLSRRDLVGDLSAALQKRGIKLGVYLPSGAPENDALACERLQWKCMNGWPRDKQERLPEFQIMWEGIIREWSQRWGDGVFAWWFDGCYFADAMYRQAEAPNFASFTAAAKAGHPQALVAFNEGTLFQTHTVKPQNEYEDYTAGEVDVALPVPSLHWDGVNRVHSGRFLTSPEGTPVQFHVFSYLGEWWGQAPPRFSAGFVYEYTRLINESGGVVTWDVAVDDRGQIPPSFVERLSQINSLR